MVKAKSLFLPRDFQTQTGSINSQFQTVWRSRINRNDTERSAERKVLRFIDLFHEVDGLIFFLIIIIMTVTGGAELSECSPLNLNS